MGQKTNALGFRLQNNKSWKTFSFFPVFNYSINVNLDIVLNRFLKGILRYFGLNSTLIRIGRGFNKFIISIIFYEKDYMLNKNTLIYKHKKVKIKKPKKKLKKN